MSFNASRLYQRHSVLAWIFFIAISMIYLLLTEVILRLKYPSYPLFGNTLEISLAVIQFSCLLFFWQHWFGKDLLATNFSKVSLSTLNLWAKILVVGTILFLSGRAVRYLFLAEDAFIVWNDEGIRWLMFIAYLKILVVIAIGYNLIVSWNTSNQRISQIEKENAEFQLEMLKTQINPHFLFNNLNTLGGLIEENPKEAGSFLQKLSTVYRTILDNREKHLIPLKNELNFFQPYKEMIETRFEQRLTIRIDHNVLEHEGWVPSLSLQILTENAIKHNVVSLSKPLDIQIYIDNNTLWVENPLQLKKQKEYSTKVGLENIRTRLQLAGSKELIVKQTEAIFRVGVPLIQDV